MRRSAAALFVVALYVASSAAQAPKSTAGIRGRVVAAATGRPVRLATITLSPGTPSGIRTVRTDANGQYELASLPAGRYAFFVTHPAYLTQEFDQPRPLARYRLLELADGEQLDGMDFSLHRGAAITGIISDEAGDPMPDVRVMALREQYGPYGRSLSQARTPLEIPTDDEGRFRVFGLLPGTYVVMATASKTDDSPSGYRRTYHPGTMNEAEAQVVRVDLGQDATADFSMIPARLARVAGIVRDSHGRSAAGARITVNERRGSFFQPAFGNAVKDDGSFDFEHMQPGEYILYTSPPRLSQMAPGSAESATVRVIVTGEDISDLVITMSAGFAVSGRVAFEGLTAAPVIKGLRMSTQEMDRSLQRMGSVQAPENGLVDATSRFRIVGVKGKVRLGGGGSGWFAKRVLLNGKDVTTSGFDATGNIEGIEVLLTDRVTTVTGTARDASGITIKDYIVAFFPVGRFDEEDRARRQRTIRPDPDGVYRIRNLPPGEYLAAAVPVMSLPIGAEWDPEFAERVRPGAIGFKLAEGQSLALSHRLIE